MAIIGEGDVNYFFFRMVFQYFKHVFEGQGPKFFLLSFFEDVLVAHMFLPKKNFFL